MKSGYLSSEFWLHLVAVILGALVSAGVLNSPGVPPVVAQIAGAVTAILGVLGYTYSRTTLKAQDAEIRAAGSIVVPPLEEKKP